MKALLSVYDKTGIVELAEGLSALGFELISTGGTGKVLATAGLDVLQISEITGFPELLDGRVKSLHPRIHGGILARREKPDHMADLMKHGIDVIDLVVVNLYPFTQVVARPEVSLEEALEYIDIGGPTLLRAAAKNFGSVTVVVDPNDYGWILRKLVAKNLGTMDKKSLAHKAFLHSAMYDAAIAKFLTPDRVASELPIHLVLNLKKLYDLRYGENPQQRGALYVSPPNIGGIAGCEQIHGKELSFNNILDADAAWSVINEFVEPAVAIIKHTNPCGLACHSDLLQAYQAAYNGDPVSAFGGIVGFNCTVTGEVAREMSNRFFEVVVAPDYEVEALDLLRKKRNLRVLKVAIELEHIKYDLHPVSGGMLVQILDALPEDPSSWRNVTYRHPQKQEFQDLIFAWKVVKHIKSNGIALAHEQGMVGMGAGQPNRVTSVNLALQSAGKRAQGSVMASDAFFPFPDSIELAARAGITAVIQPGGSIRDQEVVDAADKYGIAMVFTGRRHFRH